MVLAACGRVAVRRRRAPRRLPRSVGDWYDQIVNLAGGRRTFDTSNLIGYALLGQPTQLFFSLATDLGGRQTHLALIVEDEASVRLGYEVATNNRRRDPARAQALAGVRT